MHSQDFGERVLRTLWGLSAATPRGPRAKYTLGEVAATGVRLADGGGLAAVSLGAVARELGLTTTALYRYVDAKETLVDVMTDAAVGAPPTLGGTDWKADATSWAASLARRYAEHPWLSEVRTAGAPSYPHRIAWVDELLRVVGPRDVESPLRLALLLDAVVRGMAGIGAADEVAAPADLPGWLVDEAATRYPHFSRELHRDWGDREDELQRAVRTVLDASALP